jgi:hypothetical protein
VEERDDMQMPNPENREMGLLGFVEHEMRVSVGGSHVRTTAALYLHA